MADEENESQGKDDVEGHRAWNAPEQPQRATSESEEEEDDVEGHRATSQRPGEGKDDTAPGRATS